MTSSLSLVAVGAVCLLTIVFGALGLRLSRATSDFYVAGRSVSPRMNASAIGGEYLSAASFLGVAGLIYDFGVDQLWLPVGYTTGYLVLLVMVAAPMRRSGAYTVPDFAEARLQSGRVRLVASTLVVAIGWIYLVPQLQGASLVLQIVADVPGWVGGTVVAIVVILAVGAGGMRSITFVQAVQYWIKLTALTAPAFVLIVLWVRAGHPAPDVPSTSWEVALTPRAEGDHPTYRVYSTLIALSLGTMGLPHVLVRYYTNPDGNAARRTTVNVLLLLGLFYLLPPIYGVLGRVHLPTMPEGVRSDSIVLRLPGVVVGGLGGDLLTAVLAAGAFAALLSTASGVCNRTSRRVVPGGTDAGVERDTTTVTKVARGTDHAAGWESRAPVHPGHPSTGRSAIDAKIAAVAATAPVSRPAIAPMVESARHHTPRMSSGAKVEAATAKASPTIVARPIGSTSRLTT